MAADFHDSPVPIRLSLRYPNGLVLSRVARALSCDDKTLRVLSSERYEAGTTLTVVAPFLQGISTCWVLGISRNQEQPGYFEIVLGFVKKPVAVAAPASARRKQPSQEERNAIAEAVEMLTAGLYRLPAPKISRVLKEIPAEMRGLSLMAAAAAVIHLLREKGLVKVSLLFRNVREVATR